jgi:iron complex outermembrane receptor protein
MLRRCEAFLTGTLLLISCAMARAAAAQQPAPADTMHVHGDSLTRRPVTMQAVTITTTAPQRNEPSGTVHVSPALIRQTPALNAWDLLRQTAGLEVHDQGQGPGFASNGSIRGFTSDHSTDLALWIDGVPINEPVNGHAEGYNDWSLLMPQAVSGIEVLKGPTSALFGNFALAGVVNVTTLERMSGLDVTASGGAYGRFEGSLLAGLDRPGTGAVAGLRVLREEGWRPNSEYSLGQGHARWVRRITGATTLDAGLELYASDWHSPGFLSDSLFTLHRYQVVTDPTDGGFKRRAQERLSIRSVVGTRALWRTTVYATQGRWQLFLTTPPEAGAAHGTGSQTEEEDQRHGFGATSALTWVLARGEITAGVEGRLDHADFQRWFTTSRSRDSSDLLVTARQASGALFVQTSFDLGHHVRVTAGGRYDALSTRSEPAGQTAASRTHGVVSPKLGLLVHVPVFGAVYGNVSRGFRQTNGVIADPSLPFITAWAYEAGVKLDRGALNASAAYFRMDVDNEQTFNPVTLQSTSGGASRRQGVELEAALRVSPAITLDGDWTFNDAKYLHLINEDGDTLSGARVFNSARYVGAFGVSATPPGQRWHLRLSANVVGPYSPFDLPGVELPAYALLHFGGGVRITSRAELDLGIRNVLDHVYPELRAGAFVAPGQPRSVYASVRATL